MTLDIKIRDLKKKINSAIKKVDIQIEEALSSRQPSILVEAAKFSCLAPDSKRIRPFLVLESAKIFGVSNDKNSLCIAAAIEMIHTYSLIHDDLPAIDNDDVRRGQPSCHIEFDEPTAILTGNALFIFAFEILSESTLPSKKKCLILSNLSKILGFDGMIYGQMLDITAKNKNISLSELEKIHLLKTAKFISISCVLGALMGNASNEEIKHIENFGDHLGMIFQITDDLLDQDTKQKDECNIANLLDKNSIIKLLDQHTNKAIASLKKIKNRNTDSLKTLLFLLKNRTT